MTAPTPAMPEEPKVDYADLRNHTPQKLRDYMDALRAYATALREENQCLISVLNTLMNLKIMTDEQLDELQATAQKVIDSAKGEENAIERERGGT